MSKRTGEWFAWYPVVTGDTNRVVWLKKVYREVWGRNCWYYETPNPF